MTADLLMYVKFRVIQRKYGNSVARLKIPWPAEKCGL